MASEWQDDSVINAQVRDDDDDIPDDWENEPEEKPKKTDGEENSKVLVKAPPTTKNKLKKKNYVGDENDDDFLESLKEPDRVYTPEELDELRKRAELQKEELKLNMASDFIGTGGERHSLDNMNLISKEEFLDYSFHLYNRLELLSKSEFYPEFLDHLLNGLTKSMSVDGVKRISSTLHAILLRKQNEEREKRSKDKIKKTVKPQLKADRNTEYDSFVGEGIAGVDDDPVYDEDNDFM